MKNKKSTSPPKTNEEWLTDVNKRLVLLQSFLKHFKSKSTAKEIRTTLKRAQEIFDTNMKTIAPLKKTNAELYVKLEREMIRMFHCMITCDWKDILYLLGIENNMDTNLVNEWIKEYWSLDK